MSTTMRIKGLLAYCLCLGILLAKPLQALDEPTFYRSPLFDGVPAYNVNDWTSFVAIRGLQARADKSFNNRHDHNNRHGIYTEARRPSKHVALFDNGGPQELTRLGLAMDPLPDSPVTQTFWMNSPDSKVPLTGLFDGLPLENLDGAFALKGRMIVNEIDFTMQQNLLWGFFAYVSLPYRDITIDKIELQNLGPSTIVGPNIDPLLWPNGYPMSTFVDTDLPEILKENLFTTPWNTTFKKHGTSDLIMTVGWQGFDANAGDKITAIGGRMQLGCLFPTGVKRDENVVCALPLGYNGHWGLVLRMSAEFTVADFVTFAAQAGSTVFFREHRHMRLKTDRVQNGWFTLEKTRVKIDAGSLWDLQGYVKFDRFVKGFAVLLGYSFTRQEESRFHLQDEHFLQTTVDRLKVIPSSRHDGSTTRTFISPDVVANSDTRYHGWQTEALHFVLAYEGIANADKNIDPYVSFSYTYPLFGRNSFTSQVFGGSVGLQFSLRFA